MKSAGTSLNTCISSHWEISRIMIRVGRGVFIEDTNHQLYNACQQVGSWILPIVLISKSKYILLFLKYVKIRDLDCKKNIHLEHQFQVFVIEQLYVCPSWFKKTNICRSTYIKGCYHAPIPIMKIFIIWLKQLATDIAVQVFKISKWRFLVHFLSIYIWDAAIFMTIYSDLIVGSFEHCYISVEQTYIHFVSTPASTCNFLEHVEWETLQCNILLWMKEDMCNYKNLFENFRMIRYYHIKYVRHCILGLLYIEEWIGADI